MKEASRIGFQFGFAFGKTRLHADELASYALGLIVLMPVLFLIVILYISAQIIQVLTRASRIGRRKDSAEASLAVEI